MNFITKTAAIAALALAIVAAPAKAYEVVTGGHYENRAQTVLVDPEHYVKTWVPRQTRTETDQNGNAVTYVVKGHYERTLVPARYETETVQVWVQDTAVYPDPVYVAPPVVIATPPVIGIGVYGGWHRPLYRGGYYGPRWSAGVVIRRR